MKAYVNMILFLVVLSALTAAALTACNDLIKTRIEANKRKDKVIHILKVFQIIPEKARQILLKDKELEELSKKYDETKEDETKLKLEARRIEKIEAYLHTLSIQDLESLFAENIEKVIELNPEKEISPGEKRARIWSGKDFIKLNSNKIDPIHRIYIYSYNTGKEKAYAFEIAGTGFWDKISGFLALKAGFVQILGITFYEHKETPGLGQRIEEGWFQAQFKIWDKDIFQGMDRTVPGISFSRATGVPGVCKDKPSNEVDAITGASETSRALDRFIDKNLYTLFESMSFALSTEELKSFLDQETFEFVKSWKQKSKNKN